MSTEPDMKAERAEFESWVARVRLPYCDTTTDRVHQWIGWLAGRASPAAAVPEGALPPPAAYGYVGLTGHDPRDGHKQLIGVSVQPSGSYMKDREVKLYTEAQLRAAVEADRAQRPGHLAAPKTAETRMDTGFAGGLLVDRAQQGEPVARLDLLIQVDNLCSQIENTLYAFRGDDEAVEQAKGAIEHAKKVAAPYRAYRAATKAAAPDDATAEMLDMLGRIHPLAMDDRGDKEGRDKRLYGPVVRQQPLPVPDQACVVWRWDVMQLLSEVKQLRAYKAMNLEAAPVPDTGIPTAGEVEKAGWKWVPDEPTDEMREACRVLNYCDDIDAEWARMLAAAPSHPAEGAKK